MRLVVAIIFVIRPPAGGTAFWTHRDRGRIRQRGSARAPTMLQEFFSHVADGLREADFSITEWSKEFDASELDAADAQALKLMQWADSETEWLDAHPSDPATQRHTRPIRTS